MTDVLHVILEDVLAGTIEKLPSGRLRFTYDDSYKDRGDATPLSLSMPVQVPVHHDNVITPWLWGLLPDNDQVLTRWARRFQVSRTPFALLSTQVGEDCAGAVRFAKPEQLDRALNRTGTIDWLSNEEVASRLRELREDSTNWLGREFNGQFSLAGAQAKTALLYVDGHWGQPTGAEPTTHILKPAVAGFENHDLNEHLCLSASRLAGLLAVRTKVSRFGDESAVVIDRYDRTIEGGTIVRVHQEDLCQALGIPPTEKYQNDGGPSPATIADLLRRAMSPQVADEAVRRFTDALIWNWLIAGTDGHAKNYSLLLAGDQVRLAPLYDIASALPYEVHEKKLRLAMKIGGDYRIFPERNNWTKAASELGLDPDALIERVRELGAILPDAFADAAKTSEVVTLDGPMPVNLVNLVTERVGRCLRVLD
ncbi:MAG: type II toxin-antitoxin system HipA family toxin [Acidobacteriota bacterium]|nr:type II toxin-antitoxin system HipA family toxin [Acidobacteriota bacterium]MDE3223089.1 type II toxin-antitoxin system HipA family toxin [Acidobacteriota bacterium]